MKIQRRHEIKDQREKHYLITITRILMTWNIIPEKQHTNLLKVLTTKTSQITSEIAEIVIKTSKEKLNISLLDKDFDIAHRIGRFRSDRNRQSANCFYTM